MPSMSRDTSQDNFKPASHAVGSHVKSSHSIHDLVAEIRTLTKRTPDNKQFENEAAVINALKELAKKPLSEPSEQHIYTAQLTPPTKIKFEPAENKYERLGRVIDHCGIDPKTKNIRRTGNKTVVSYAPTVCFADNHGNFNDLANFFRSLCNENGELPPNIKFLGLGDYVGKSDAEDTFDTLLLLFNLAKRYPNQFDFLRGNHEINAYIIEKGLEWLEVFSNTEKDNVKKIVASLFEQLPVSATISPTTMNASGNLEFSTKVFASHGAPLFFPQEKKVVKAKAIGAFSKKNNPQNALVWNQPCMLPDQIEGTCCRNNNTGTFIGSNTKEKLEEFGFRSALCGHGHDNDSSEDHFFHRIFSNGPKQQYGFIGSDGTFKRYSKATLNELKAELFAESCAYEELLNSCQHTKTPLKRQKNSSAKIQQCLCEKTITVKISPPRQKKTESPHSPKRVVFGLLKEIKNHSLRTADRYAKAEQATQGAFELPSTQPLMKAF